MRFSLSFKVSVIQKDVESRWQTDRQTHRRTDGQENRRKAVQKLGNHSCKTTNAKHVFSTHTHTHSHTHTHTHTLTNVRFFQEFSTGVLYLCPIL